MVSGGGALKVGELFASLGLDSKDYDRGLDQAEDRAGRFGKGVEGASKVATAAIAGIAVGAAAGMFAAVKSAANYEFAISAVGAVANATEGELAGLSATGLRIGRETAFSATEAAQAMEILAANGVSVADIMGGAADAAVALAAAGGTDLRTAADLASTSMAVWGLTTADMTDVVNRMAGAANVSRFGVEDMAMAVAQGGGAAKIAGVEFGDFASSIAAIAPSFASGSDAGTSFKTFLNGLTPSTDKASKAMRELGILTEDEGNRFFDAQGNLKSMADVVDILHNATKDLSEEQKSQALVTIFGTDAMRAAAGLSRLTRDEFVKLDKVMAETDAAAVAKRRLDNLSGAMEALKGSLEVVAIEVGTVFLPVLKDLANWLATAIPEGFDKAREGIQWMRDHLPEVSLVAGGLAGILSAVMVPGLLAWAGAALGVVKALAPLALGGGIIGALIAAALLVVTNWDKIVEKVPALGEAVDAVREPIRKLAGLFETGFDGGKIAGNFSGIETAAFNLGGKFREARDAIGEVAHFFSLGFGGGKIVGEFSETQTKAFEVGQALREGLGAALSYAGDRLREMGEVLTGTVFPVLQTVAGFIASGLVGAFQAVAGFITGTVLPVFAAFGGWISGTLLPLLDQAREKFNNDVLPALETVAEGFELVGRAIVSVFGPPIEGALVLLGLLRDMVVGVFGVIVSVITENAGLFVAVLKTAWDTIWSTISLALELIRDTVSIVLALLRGDWEGAWQGMVTLVSNVLDNLAGIVGGALATVQGVFQLAFELIRDTIMGIFEGLGGWIGDRIGEWIDSLRGLLDKIPAAAYKLMGLNKEDIVGAPKSPATDIAANVANAVGGPDVARTPGYMGGALGTPWAGAPPLAMPAPGNVVTIERMDVGVRPDIPGGVDPTPIRAALEEIDFSNWDTEAVS